MHFDPVRKRVVATYPTTPGEIAWGYDSIWATTRDHQLLRINLRTNRIASRLRLSAGRTTSATASRAGTARSRSRTPTTRRSSGSTLLRTRSSAASRNSARPTRGCSVTTGDGSVWLYRITREQGIVYRIDPYTNQIVKRIPVGYPNAAWPNGYIDDAGGYVWTCEAGNTMSQIDPRSNRVVGW